MDIKHDAFISYNHHADSELAEALEAGMEKLAKRLFSLRAIDVFRDATGLAANPNLWGEIVDHLGGTKWLVVLACPEWAGSRWCHQEALWWIEKRSVDRILIALTGGELAWDGNAGDFDWTVTTALSKELSGRFRQEPLFVDLRWARGRDGLTLHDVQFRDAVLSLSAAIRGVRKDELGGEDVRQLRRTLKIAYSAAGVLFALTVIAGLAGYGFLLKRDEALLEAKIALGGKLAAESNALRFQRSELLPHSLLKAVESIRRFPSLAADQAIRSGLALLPRQLKALQHNGAVAAVAVQPGGNLLATAGPNGDVVVWDLDGERQYSLEDKVLRHAPVLFSPGGKLLATSDRDHGTRLRDARTGRAVGDPLTSQGMILRMAFNADGSRLAVLDGSESGTINIWDTSTRKLVKTLKLARMDRDPFGHHGLAFSPDGHLAVVAYSEVLVWDETWKEQPRMRQSLAVADFAFGPDRPFLLAVAEQTGTILLFDAPASAPSKTLELGSGIRITKLAFSPDGKMLAAGTAGGEARVWSTQDWKPTATMRHEATISSLAFDPSGSLLATASTDNTAAVWDAQTGEKQTSMDHGDHTLHVAFSPNGQRIFTGSADGSARAWETTAGVATRLPGDGLESMYFTAKAYWAAEPGNASVVVWRVPDRRREEISIGEALHVLPTRERGQPAISASGKIALGGADDIVRVRDLVSGREIAAFKHVPDVDWDAYQRRHGPSHTEMDRSWQRQHAEKNGTVWSVGFSPGDRFLVTSRADSVLRVWDLSTKELVWEEPFGRFVPEQAFSPSGQLLAVVHDGKVLQVTDLAARKKVLTAPLEGELQSVAFSNDGRLVVIGDDNRRQQGDFHVRAWRTSDWRELGHLGLEKHESAFALSPKDDALATYGPDKNVRVLQLGTGKDVARIPTSGDVKQVVFNQDGTRIAVVTRQNVIVWDLRQNRELLSAPHNEEPETASFSIDDEYLATGGATLARIFTLNGDEVAQLNHGKPVRQIRFILDGKYIASADPDGARVWLWRPADLVAEACSRLDRKLLPSQWPDNPDETIARRLEGACNL